MSYSCSDFTDTILDALAVELTEDEMDSPSAQADKALAAIDSLRPFWAIAFHTNSVGPRARRWYRIARMISVDGKTFELYWHDSLGTRGNSRADIVTTAKALGIVLAPGTYSDGPAPRLGSTMIRRS